LDDPIVEVELRRLAASEQLVETAYRSNAAIQGAARALATPDWPRIAYGYGFGNKLVGAEAIRAVQALAAHQNLVSLRLADVFKTTGVFTVAQNVQRTVAGLQGVRSGMIEQTLAPLRAYRTTFAGLAESVRSFAEQQREIDEQLDAFVLRHGWPIPLNLPMRAYAQIVRMADRPKREVTAAMVEWFRPESRVFRTSTSMLLARPVIEDRRPLIRQVLRAHRRGEHYLVVNGLLPLVEGVLVDGVFGLHSAPVSSRVRAAMDKLAEDDPGDSLVRAIGNLVVSGAAGMGLFARSDPRQYGIRGEPRTLNRHAILHGYARRYGSRANALRMILLLTVLVEVIELQEIGRT
jgi:hypothetical protein